MRGKAEAKCGISSSTLSRDYKAQAYEVLCDAIDCLIGDIERILLAQKDHLPTNLFSTKRAGM
jgi:hypothetical protein